MAAIRRYARRIAERFEPKKIILFGSYAYGTPHEDSDVDLLVVMPAANEVSQAVRIRWSVATHSAFTKIRGSNSTRARNRKNCSSIAWRATAVSDAKRLAESTHCGETVQMRRKST